MKVEDLRKLGLVVMVRHNWKIKNNNLSCKGGNTEVGIYNKQFNLLANGVAKCSKRDNYNRKLGLQIALGRAWKNFTKKTQGV